MVQNLHILSFTHKYFRAEELAAFYIEPDRQTELLSKIKQDLGWSELMYLGTCNRVEVVFVSPQAPLESTIRSFLSHVVKPEVDLSGYLENMNVYGGFDAVRHLFRVVSSLDSMVVGEREIITQVREAFERCDQAGLCGDHIRLFIKKTIETGKAVYTHTNIAKNPVSVVSLAFHKLLSTKGIHANSKILMVGAGQTNTAFARILKKHEFSNIHIFNRTFEKAQKLALELGLKAYPLNNLNQFQEGFDVIITCTGSENPVITATLFENNPSANKRYVFDLAIPSDLEKGLDTQYNLHITGIESLKELADKNLKQREQELDKCEHIIEERLIEYKTSSRLRKVDLAMRAVPDEVKNIKKTALNEVFAQDIQGLDENSKEVLDKILDYMEKKYIRVPMKMAREILLETDV